MSEPVSYLRYGVALLLVIGLIMLAAAALRVFGGRKFGIAQSSGKNLFLREQLWLDARYRAVVLDYKGSEYFILLGPDKAEVLAKNDCGSVEVASDDKK